MHTALQRLNGVSSFLSSALCALAFCIAITSFFIPSNPTADLRVSNFRVKNGRAPKSSSKAVEYAFINFDLDADLSSLFNWNTKQVFAYLVAEYKTSKYESNSATIWDQIMNGPEDGHIKLYSAPQKYQFRDITGNFRGVNATYTLRWNVVPWVGIMQWGKSKDGYITLPQREGES